MRKLKEYFSDKKNMHKFFCKSIFNDDIDFLVIYHEGVFNVFEREEVLNIFDKHFLVRNSAGKQNSIGSQKVVFDYNNKLTIELEVRTTDDGKYPSLLLVTNKLKIWNILLNNIKEKKDCTNEIRVWGKAISGFKI